jgi:hypothetical protein
MASDAVNIAFRPSKWSRQVADDLRTVASHSERDLIAFRTSIDRGEMQVLEVWHGADRVGSLVWSIMPEIGRRVLVINALAARPVPGVSVALVVKDRFAEFAKVLGCRALRCWTQRAGLVRVLENNGAATASHVIELEV